MKKITSNDSLPRHEAIIALKQIAMDRNDPYLADQIEIWIQRFIVQFNRESEIEQDTLKFVKDPIDYLDHIKKKGLIELGAGAANLAAEIFDVEDDYKKIIKFRVLALRPEGVCG